MNRNPTGSTITVASSASDIAHVRRLFGAHQRAVASFADAADICA